PGRARGRRPRQSELSLIRFPRVVEGVARPTEGVAELLEGLARLGAVIARGVDVILGERLGTLVAAAQIIAADDRVVLASTMPLEQRELDREQSHAREEWQVAHAEVEQNDRNRHVGDVPAHDVTQLMRKYETLLFLCERVDGAGVHDDERVVEADGAGIHEWRLGDVKLGPCGPIEGLQHLGVDLIESRALAWSDANGVGEEELANPTLAEEAGDL